MKILTEINILTRGVALIVLLLLPACTKAPWQAEFWQLPEAAEGVAPLEEGQSSPIRRAGGEDKPWPKLSSVPTERPTRPLSEEEAQLQVKELEADKARAAP